MDRSRWIGYHFADKMDWNKSCSNGAESFNAVAKHIQAREVLPAQAVHLLTLQAQKQLHDFINSICLRMSSGHVVTKFCMEQYTKIAARSKELVVLKPLLFAPYATHTVSERKCQSATFEVCVHPQHASCDGPACVAIRKMGLPCEHMICVAHQEFHKLEHFNYYGCKYMAENFSFWVHNSGLFYQSYAYTSTDFDSFVRVDAGHRPSTVRVPVPNSDDCIREAAFRPALKIRGILDFEKQTKRYRSKGEVGSSSAVIAPRPVAADDAALAVQQRLLADRQLVGKSLMLVYPSPHSKSRFRNKAKTKVNGQPRPVIVRGLPRGRQDGKFVFPVTCALADRKTDRLNGVRTLLLCRVTECYEVESITAGMKRGEWRPPRQYYLRQRVT
eukprot:SAG25_NODE_708_length_5832_cov_2.856794_4_plen_387_part_00